MNKVSKKAKRRFLFLTLIVFGVFIYMIITLAGYWSKILDNKSTAGELGSKYELLLEEEDSLKSEVTKLQDPDYVARYASEKFLYSKDGMTIIRIID